MKSMRLLTILMGIALVPAVAHAGPLVPDRVAVGDIIKVDDYNNSNSGGPFKVDNQTVGKPDNWLTFCIETNEFLNFGVKLQVVGITNKAVLGGAGGGNGSQDLLDARTAYLYTEYRKMGGSTNATVNNAYQNAIWYIEGEGGSNNSLVAQANLAVAVGGSWYGKGLGQVRVMNLVWGENSSGYKKGDRAQDLLTIVPDGGTTLALLGGALMGLGLVRRKYSL
jgi:hypothetical protein